MIFRSTRKGERRRGGAARGNGKKRRADWQKGRKEKSSADDYGKEKGTRKEKKPSLSNTNRACYIGKGPAGGLLREREGSRLRHLEEAGDLMRGSLKGNDSGYAQREEPGGA